MAEDEVTTHTEKRRCDLLVIGGSAGSLMMVLKMLPLFTSTMPFSVIIVFHRKQTDEQTLIEMLSTKTECLVKEVEDKDVIQPGVIYIAPADYHVLVEKDKTLTLDDSEKINFSRPSIDATFESAAEAFHKKLACLLLSGANADGVDGLIYARKNGALILVQNPATAEVSYMPQQAVERVTVDGIIDPSTVETLSHLLFF